MRKSLHPALILLLPPLAGGLLAALPIAPPGKMIILAVAAGVLSVALLGLSVFDTCRPAPNRIAMPLVWLAMSGGFACLTVMLWTMAHTWSLPLQRMPLGKETMLFFIMAILLAASISGMIRAIGRVGQVKAGS